MALFFLRLWKLGSENDLLPSETHAPDSNQKVDYCRHGGARPLLDSDLSHGLHFPNPGLVEI